MIPLLRLLVSDVDGTLVTSDKRLTPASVAAAAALREAGVAHELVTYDGAPHSFFDRKHEEFQAASDDAWRRTLDFIAANS